MSSVIYAKCPKIGLYAECLYDECHCDECLYSECHYAECRGAVFGPNLKLKTCPRFHSVSLCLPMTGDVCTGNLSRWV